MTDDEIRTAAMHAYCVTRSTIEESVEAVYRAGMEAERARCIEIAQGEEFETPSGCRTVAYLRAYNDGIYAVVDRLKAPTKGTT